MQIKDKIREINNDFTEFGRLYEEINAELDKPSPQLSTLKKLLDQKDHLWKQRTQKLKQLQVLIDKLNADWKLKLEKHWPSKEG